LTVHGVSQNEDGTYSWKFDNYVRAFSPAGFTPVESQHFWSRITCPTLLIRGTESWASDPLKDGRAEHFQNAQVVNIENAGHWVHHDQLSEFLELVESFLED
jgi:pimeloyl-ACP methyl ester carboxylesterase